MAVSSSSMSGADHIRRKELHCAVALAFTAEWNVADGAPVDHRQVVGTVGSIELGNLQQLVAPSRGTLRILTAEQVKTLLAHAAGENTQEGEAQEETKPAVATVPIAYVEYCIHPLMNGRTCMMCLAVVDDDEEELDEERRSVNVVSHGQVLRLNVEEAKKFDHANIKRQLSSKKLSLVLDLDHTLLHAVRVEDISGAIPQTDDTHFFFIPGLPSQHVVKLRPGLIEFLEELSTLYDLFIYTHGTRTYAEQIAKIIDPKSKFFQHRIVARTDTPDMLHKSLKLLFPSCDDSMILVLDDRIDVWKENEGNVFLIEPYHYFNSTREINNASGHGVLAFEDGETTDVHLQHAKRVLTEVHRSFYGDDKSITLEDQMSGKGGDVKQILTEHKKTVLQGCNIVFSGLFPLQGPRKPESHYLWRLAVELGARLSTTMDSFPLTHLVIHPGRLDTQKHNQAKNMPGVVVVVPEWMLKSARIWSRAPESEFLADEWKAKQAKIAAEKKAAAETAAVTSSESISTNADGKVDEEESMEVDPPAGEGGEEKTADKPPPESILVKESRLVLAPVETKADRKTVKFSAEVDATEEKRTQEAKEQNEARQVDVANGGIRTGPRRPLRRVIGGGRMRAGGPPRVPEVKGTVASGGTFDFLSKIAQLGASKRPPTAAPALSSASTPVKPADKPTPAPAPAKDIDDAFLRLIEAEEEESAQEQKRKRSATDVKSQLASRRNKRSKTDEDDEDATSHAVSALDAPTARDAALYRRAVATAAVSYSASVNEDGEVETAKPDDDPEAAAVINGTAKEEEEDEEEDLDDLEADILDAL